MSWKKWIAAVCIGVPLLGVIAVFIVVNTYDFNNLKPRIESAVQESTGRKLTMAGDIELDFGFSPALVVERVALENAKWGSKPEMMTCERFELEVGLLPLITGDVRIKRLVVVEPVMLVEKSEQGRFNYEFETGAKPKEKTAPEKKEEQAGRGLPDLEVNTVRIEGAKLEYKDHAADTGFTARLDEMHASARSMSAPLEFDLEGAFKELPFSLSGEIGSMQSLVRGEELPFRLRAELAEAEAVIEGNRTVAGKTNGLTADVDVQADSLAGINELAGSDLPEDVPIGLDAAISSSDMQTITVEGLEMRLGDSVIRGGAEVDMGGSVPAVQASLTSEELDLRPLVPEGEAATGQEESGTETSADGGERVFPDTPVNADFLHQVDAAVRTEIGRLLLPGLQCENLRVDLAMANGELRVAPLRLETAGGSLKGELGVQDLKQGVAVTSKMDIQKLDLRKYMAMAGHKDFLRGNLESNLDVAASGESVAGLMGDMNGEAVVIVGEGRLDSEYLEKFGGNVLNTLREYLDPEQKSEEYTRINCLVSGFDIKKGVADSRIILMDTEKMQLLADGKVDLGTEKLDFSFDPSPKEGLDTGAMGNISLSLSELSQPFKLSGTLANPSIALNVKGAALTLGKVIGGAAVGGPAGAAAALLGGSGGEGTPCSEAVAVARGEKEPAREQPAQKKETTDTKKESTEGGAVEKGLDRLKKGVEDLF